MPEKHHKIHIALIQKLRIEPVLILNIGHIMNLFMQLRIAIHLNQARRHRGGCGGGTCPPTPQHFFLKYFLPSHTLFFQSKLLAI